MNRKTDRFRSILVFVASLLVSVGATSGFGVSSASADASRDCKFGFQTPFSSNSPYGVDVGATFECHTNPVYRQISFTLELWYKKLDPKTGRYVDKKGCENTITLDERTLIGNGFFCEEPNAPGRGTFQLRGRASGYDGWGQEFALEGSGPWTDL